MSPDRSAADLMRSVGLDLDGPARWGTKPPSRAPGVFAIEAGAPSRQPAFDIVEVRRWIERVPDLRVDGQRPTENALAQRLASFWIPGQTLLYVGRTSKSLNGRVGALYATELGHRLPHAGGHWLKTLREPGKLRIWWAETDAPEEYEDAILTAFAEALPDETRDRLPADQPILPWANLASPGGEARESGVTASLLTADDTPTRPTNVRRSDAPGRSRTRTPAKSSAAPASPRRTATRSAQPAPSLRDRPTPMTAEGRAALEAELAQLTKVERPQVVERVKSARELGDLRENADYEAARNEQSFLEGRILELEQRLRTAVIIENGSGSAIAMGSTVRYELEGDAGELTIVGSTESDPSAGRISAASPVGKALLGHRAGDEVIVRTPASEMRYRIVEIS